MKSVNERIKFLIKELNLNNRSFSLKLGVDPTVVHNIVSGRKSMPSSIVLEKIVLTFENVDARWLLTGRGTYANAFEQTSFLNEALPVYEKSTKEATLENEIINLKGQIEAYKNVIASFSNKKPSE